jgi:hypothetical protein
MIDGSLVTTAGRVLGVRMEGSCEYIEYAVTESRQGVILKFRRSACG